MTMITIPRTIEGVDRRNAEINGVYTTTGWERAALLASVVQLPGSGGPANRRSAVCSAEQYAERKVPGLSSANTVRLYVQRWLDAHDGLHPQPGAKVELPDLAWPPVDKSDAGSRVAADPAKAVAQVIDKHGAEAFIAATVDSLTGHELAVLDSVIRNEHLPQPPRPTADHEARSHVITDQEATKAASTVYRQRLAADAGEWTPSPTTVLLWHLLSDVLAASKPAELDLDSELAELLGGG